MIVKGIVSGEELMRIQAVLSMHGLTEGKPGEFCTWTEEYGGGNTTWVELDVNDSVFRYLTHSGFFATADKPRPVKEIHCPHCGNSDLDLIHSQIERTCFLFHELKRDADGVIYAVDDVSDVKDCTDILSSQLSCRKCMRPFPNPGIATR